MSMSQAQKQFFAEQGYLQIPAAVPGAAVRAALRAINHSIGIVGKTGRDPARYRVDSFCHELRHAPVLCDIFNRTSIFALAEALLGKGNVLPVEEVQIAPRFPLPVGEAAPPLSGHLDAAGTGTNGYAAGTYSRNFTLLAVVYLVDVPEPDSGNFTVWPRSHIETRDFFRHTGHEILYAGDPDIELSAEPIMLTGSAGDVFLGHHLIQHVGGHNISPRVRHALISRMRHRHAAVLDKGAFIDMWREWEGLADIVPACG